MTEPVLMDKAELEKMAKGMAQTTEVVDGLKRDLKIARGELDQIHTVANRAKGEVERLRKTMPSDQMEKDNKGLRAAVSESHKKIGALEKELAVVKAESEARRKEVIQIQRRFDSVQNTFDMMQVARDKACADRDKAFVDLQGAGDAYHKLNGEFEEFKKAVAEKGQGAKK